MSQSSAARKPLTRLAVVSARHWKVTLLLWAVLLGAGGYAYLGGLPREGFPAINTPVVLVRGPLFADDPEVVDAEVAQPLTQAILAVEGVTNVDSFAGRNFSTLVVEFDSSFSSADGVAAIEGTHVGVIPAEIDISYDELDAAGFLNSYDLLVSVIATDAPARATDQDLSAVRALQDQAERVAEYLLADPDIEVAEVKELLTEAVDPQTGEFISRQTNLARVYQSGNSSFLSSITIGIDRADTGLDTIQLSERVEHLLRDAPAEQGYESRITADLAVDIRNQLSSLQGNLMTGLIAVAIVSLLLIGWRTALITSAFMITVMAATLVALMVSGQSLNTITLFALILTLGLLVDDAVVIAESIDANRGEFDADHSTTTAVDVVKVAIDRVGTASFSGTLTTVLVFAPMLFVTGILGEFIRVMPITVMLALTLSFFLSISLISALAAAFLLRGPSSNSAAVRAQRWLAERLARGISLIDRNRFAGIGLTVVSIAFSIGVVFVAFSIAGTLTFNIFPPSKDSNKLEVEADFSHPDDADDGTRLARAEALADQVDALVINELGDDLVAAGYFFSGRGGVNMKVDLTDFNDRGPTANDFATNIEAAVEALDDVTASVIQIDNGPPAAEFPFAVQIEADTDPVAAQALADELAFELDGSEVIRANGDPSTVVETLISTDGTVTRTNGERIIEVRARFADDDTTALVDAAKSTVNDRYGAEELTARGLSADALNFDFGQESENQDDFASTQVVFMVALAAMLILLVVQFRSLVQPVLIMLAIPFGLFGVFAALKVSDNPISFFVMIGLIGLIGVVVNNTILLTDAANQAWRSGASDAEAMAIAIRQRFRPLIATTATTVVGLTPLALSDPFWEPLAFTIMFGLIASTLLVLVSFPFYYLALAGPARRLFARVFRGGRRPVAART